MADLVPVRVRDCACPNAPHAGEEGDIVFLAPTLSLEGGLAAEEDLDRVTREKKPDLLRRLWLVTFVRYGVVGWNFTNGTGKDRSVDVEELLSNYELSQAVADKAADLYAEAVTRPLRLRLNAPSPTGPIGGQTSRTPRSTRKRRSSSLPATSAGPPSEAQNE